MENQQKIRKIQRAKKLDHWNGRKKDPKLGSVEQKSKFVKNFTDFARLGPKIVKIPKQGFTKRELYSPKKSYIRFGESELRFSTDFRQVVCGF